MLRLPDQDSQAPAQPLARFSLAGRSCVVVPAADGTDEPVDCLGTLVLEERRYAVLAETARLRPDLVDILTPRELEIALLIAGGQDAKVIARRLRISFHTVRVHLGRVYAKLGLHKQTELAARIAAQFGSMIGG